MCEHDVEETKLTKDPQRVQGKCRLSSHSVTSTILYAIGGAVCFITAFYEGCEYMSISVN